MSFIFPEYFLESIEGCAAFNHSAFTDAHTKPPVVSIRLNPRKRCDTFTVNEKIPWCENGYYLKQRPSFTLDPLLHAGTYYVQEASSMFLDYILKQILPKNDAVKILDLCAAPGGKSTLIASAISSESLLISNEVIRSRLHALKENSIKWGNDNVIITNNDPKDFSVLGSEFDVLVIDAPCSGSGLFRKDKHAVKEWSKENVLLCTKRQKRILNDCIPALKKNGFLIYCTCSYSKEENEDIVEMLENACGFETVAFDIPDGWGIIQNRYGYRFYPDKLQGEGFFIACLQKKSDSPDTMYLSETKKIIFADIKEVQILSSWIKNAEQYVFHKQGENIYALKKEYMQAYMAYDKHLKVIRPGIEVGRIAGNDLIPSHELAMSSLMQDAIPTLPLNETEALKFLKKESLDSDIAMRGWVLITYKNQNLGWIKAIPNRINNYYPVEYRILKHI